MRPSIAHEGEMFKSHLVQALWVVRNQELTSWGLKGVPISSVILVHNLQLLYWQGQGQNPEF